LKVDLRSEKKSAVGAALIAGVALSDFNRLRTPRRLETQSNAGGALGNNRLLFDFKVLVDIFTVNAQLPRTIAIGAGNTHKTRG